MDRPWLTPAFAAREQALKCPGCGAANAPGRTVIELQRAGDAVCGCCAKRWTPKKENR